MPTLKTLDQLELEVATIRGDQDIRGEAHTQTDSSDSPDTPSEGHIIFSTAGHMRYASGVTGDSNYYATGRNTNPATGSLTFTTSYQTVPGIGASVGVGTYHYHAQILINNPGTAGQGGISLQFSLNGGMTVSNGRFCASELIAGTSATASWANWDSVSGGSVTGGNAPGSNTNNRVWTVDAIMIVSVAGSFTVQMKQAATAACNTVQYGTYGETFPVI